MGIKEVPETIKFRYIDDNQKERRIESFEEDSVRYVRIWEIGEENDIFYDYTLDCLIEITNFLKKKFSIKSEESQGTFSSQQLSNLPLPDIIKNDSSKSNVSQPMVSFEITDKGKEKEDKTATQSDVKEDEKTGEKQKEGVYIGNKKVEEIIKKRPVIKSSTEEESNRLRKSDSPAHKIQRKEEE